MKKIKLIVKLNYADIISVREKLIAEAKRSDTLLSWNDNTVETKDMTYLLKAIEVDNIPLMKIKSVIFHEADISDVINAYEKVLNALIELTKVKEVLPEATEAPENEDTPPESKDTTKEPEQDEATDSDPETPENTEETEKPEITPEKDEEVKKEV